MFHKFQNKLLIKLVVLLLLSNFSFGQNYVDYHKRRMIAEQAILDTNYEKAVSIYDSLFTEYDFVYARNCYTACQTAIEIGNMDKAFSFMRRGVLQGLKMDVINQDSILVDLKKDFRWKEFTQEYDSLRRTYIGKVNWELRFKMNQLYDLDQKWRDKHELYPWNFLWRPFIWAKWKRITKKIVVNELIPIIDSLGFPAEKLIGLDEKWMHYKFRTNGKESSFAFMILVHYYSKPREADLNEKFYREIEKGNITPEHYASLIDFQAKWGKGKYFKGLYYNQWHATKDSTLFSVIDCNRQAIGLDTIKAHELKLKRGLDACKKIKQGNYRHIRLFDCFCG